MGFHKPFISGHMSGQRYEVPLGGGARLTNPGVSPQAGD